MNGTYRKNVPTPVGTMHMVSDGQAITEVHFGPGPEGEPCPVLDQCQTQLAEYFAGERTDFVLPLSPKGTEFQRTVWDLLRTIPYGATMTYGRIAELAGSPKGARAVGMACNRNPIAVLIPCHRVVGSSGSLTGYAGGLAAKQFLLDLERSAGNG